MSSGVACQLNRKQNDGIAIANSIGQAGYWVAVGTLVFTCVTTVAGYQLPLGTMYLALILGASLATMAAWLIEAARLAYAELLSPDAIRLPNVFDCRLVHVVKALIGAIIVVQFNFMVKLAGGQSRDETAPPDTSIDV
jgi:hypothetical protein